MPEELERIAKLEGGLHTAKGRLNDHEDRLRKVERLSYGILIAGAIIGWGLTQVNNVIKIMGAA